MKNPFSQSEIVETVIDILANVLGIKRTEITKNTAIVNDLDADSLDFVELNTCLEKKFNFSLPKKSALDYANKLSGHADMFYSSKSGLTNEGLALLSDSRFEYHQLSTGMMLYDIFNATTVGNLAHMCYRLFNYLPETCPECGHHEAVVSPAGKAICATCSTTLRPMRGDDVQSTQVSDYLSKLSLPA